jgi:hypothetical protein
MEMIYQLYLPHWGGGFLPVGTQPSAGQLGYTYFHRGTSTFSNPTASATNVATIPGSTLSAGTYLVNLVYTYTLTTTGAGAGFLTSIKMNVSQTSQQIGGTPSATNLLTYGQFLNSSNNTGPYSGSTQISGTMFLGNTLTPIYISAIITIVNLTVAVVQLPTYCQFTRIA